ncbi:hypothetical protein D3C73_1183150 [compost metagenome]
MKIILTKHANERSLLRNIHLNEIEQTILFGNKKYRKDIVIYEYNYHVVVLTHTNDNYLIITVYYSEPYQTMAKIVARKKKITLEEALRKIKASQRNGNGLRYMKLLKDKYVNYMDTLRKDSGDFRDIPSERLSKVNK